MSALKALIRSGFTARQSKALLGMAAPAGVGEVFSVISSLLAGAPLASGSLYTPKQIFDASKALNAGSSMVNLRTALNGYPNFYASALADDYFERDEATYGIRFKQPGLYQVYFEGSMLIAGDNTAGTANAQLTVSALTGSTANYFEGLGPNYSSTKAPLLGVGSTVVPVSTQGTYRVIQAGGGVYPLMRSQYTGGTAPSVVTCLVRAVRLGGLS